MNRIWRYRQRQAGKNHEADSKALARSLYRQQR